MKTPWIPLTPTSLPSVKNLERFACLSKDSVKLNLIMIEDENCFKYWSGLGITHFKNRAMPPEEEYTSEYPGSPKDFVETLKCAINLIDGESINKKGEKTINELKEIIKRYE